MKLFSTYLLMASLLGGILATNVASADIPAEPSIIITHAKDKTFYEYTLNGQILEIKVVPKVGPTYYLVPAGGSNEEFKRLTQSSLVIPKWVIFSW